MKKTIVLAGCLLLLLNSCYNDKYTKLYPAGSTTVTCDTTTVSLRTDIMPIISANCAISGGCHDASGAPLSGYNFNTYADLQTAATGGLLLPAINWSSTTIAMPLNGAKLPSCDINKFTAWVNQGSKNN